VCGLGRARVRYGTNRDGLVEIVSEARSSGTACCGGGRVEVEQALNCGSPPRLKSPLTRGSVSRFVGSPWS
jgi:hypothetical protein